MKVGVFSILPDAAADPAVVARHAEDLGFSSYWVPDHVVLPAQYSTPYPGKVGDGPDPDYLWQMPDPLIALMRAATATTRIEVGTAVLLVPERHPLHLAKEIASLDAYSQGRFHFGIGAGWNKEECELFGGDFEHRWTQVREAIAAMKACWTQDDSEYHGKYVDFDPIWSWPKPVQKPHPPIVMGAASSWGRERVARYCDGWVPLPMQMKNIDSEMADLNARLAQHGRQPGDIEISFFWAPEDADELKHYRDLGVHRAILGCPADSRDATLTLLDKHAALMAAVG